jgi:type I restriction-modification system DNA methylase subunit
MTIDLNRARRNLQTSNFRKLFIEDMGWDHPTSDLDIQYNGDQLHLTAVAQKRGLTVLICSPLESGKIPDYADRRKIETQLRKLIHEHILIFTNVDYTKQVWQWVRREPGRPTTSREYEYYQGQSGQALLERLQGLVFTLEEEESLGIIDVASRVRATFDVERVTRRFYDRFREEHAAFMRFLKGIPDDGMQRWYVSVTLNRLMFVYFIQKKQFLNGDENYLRSKLIESKSKGQDLFYSDFLCPLFFEGFAMNKDERKPEMKRLLGDVPYLNGGIFQQHQIEIAFGKKIQISDSAFERVFNFFDQYRWHLDERPLRNDSEINPDVLGYIFEKYINQKEMGAYYTKEDITGYISRSTILPYLLDQAQKDCAIAFKGEQSVWRLLSSDPRRYIFPSIQKGCDLSLPAEIQAGVEDVSKRQDWNKSALEEYSLPTETWREVVARRTRYEDLVQKLGTGEIHEVNDLITYNLDIEQFSQDVVEASEGPELLRAFWKALRGIKVLDPTCGSGAFLFAALNILEPLYEACLERMRVFIAELEQSAEKHRPEKFSDFREVLGQVEQHHNERYFILKSIIVNNLYGVDIMEEAVEICKLRLFLKLIAQNENGKDVEPLPDIDFNIRAGNTLVGFTSINEVRHALMSEGQQMRMLYPEEEAQLKNIEEKADFANRAYHQFQRQQLEKGTVTVDDKKDLRARLEILNKELNRALARTYGVDPDTLEYSTWLEQHQPFHWLIDFYGIMNRGGFDVIIGNPPYVELSQINYKINGFNLKSTGNLYSICIERFTSLLFTKGKFGVIIPISAVSTPRMHSLMGLLQSNFSPLFISNFAVRPGKLFVGTDMNLNILIGQLQTTKNKSNVIWASRYIRWLEKERPQLFQLISFSETELIDNWKTIPKIGEKTSKLILARIREYSSISKYRTNTIYSDVIYYHSGGRYFRKCLRDKLSNEYKEFRVTKGLGDSLLCLLNSSLFYWFWIVISDCYHVTLRDIDAFPIPDEFGNSSNFTNIANSLLNDLFDNSTKRRRNRSDGQIIEEYNFSVGKSKQIIDSIDKEITKYFHFSDEELDFIINYDFKYRMGADTEDE